MLTIRPEQDKVLRKYMLAHFKETMQQYLRSRFPAQTQEKSEAELAELVSRGCEAAKRYKIISREDTRRFLECLVVHGITFPDTQDWARAILFRDDVSGARKMDLIADYELFHLRIRS